MNLEFFISIFFLLLSLAILENFYTKLSERSQKIESQWADILSQSWFEQQRLNKLGQKSHLPYPKNQLPPLLRGTTL